MKKQSKIVKLPKISNLYSKITERDRLFKKVTAEIIKSLRPKLNEVVSKLLEDSDIDIVWIGIERLAGTTNFVSVFGVIASKVGEKFYVDELGEEVTITPENKHEFSKKIDLVIKFKVLEHGSVEEILENIKDSQKPNYDLNNLEISTTKH